MTSQADSAGTAAAPARAGLVLGTLILVAGVANLNLSVANVALPDIGKSFDASQTTLDLIAVGYSLGLAASVLWFGALGDRYGRKLMIVLGMSLTIPACLLAGFAPSSGVLFAARVLGGLAAGMAYPTTLALITALWSGAWRTKSIALWSALGGGIALLGPLISGALLEHFSWGSVFLVTLPLVAIALPMAIFFVPSHVNEGTEPVDNLGGVLSAVLVGGLIVSINFLPVPSEKTVALVLLAVAAVAGILFYLRQRRAANPLYDLHIAARPTFWVAACAGIIVFGSLMGAAYISQQFLQNVLGYSTLQAGAAIIPAGLFMVAVAPRSAKLVGLARVAADASQRAGVPLRRLPADALALEGEHPVLGGRDPVHLPRDRGRPRGHAVLELAHGIGAGDPRRHGLRDGRPAARPGRGADDLDLRRAPHRRLRLGDGAAIAELGAHVTQSTQATLQLSYSSAEDLAAQHPHYASQITAAAQSSFLKGDQWAYLAAMIAILIGMALVFRFFPKKDAENALRAAYHAHGHRGRAGRRCRRLRCRSLLPAPARPSSRGTSLRPRSSNDIPALVPGVDAERSRSSRAGTSPATTRSSTSSRRRRTRSTAPCWRGVPITSRTSPSSGFSAWRSSAGSAAASPETSCWATSRRRSPTPRTSRSPSSSG